MSHHHILPPITYTPEPRPKKIETRKRRINVGGTEAFDEMDELRDGRAAGDLKALVRKLIDTANLFAGR